MDISLLELLDYYTLVCLSYRSLRLTKRTIIKISDICGKQYEKKYLRIHYTPTPVCIVIRINQSYDVTKYRLLVLNCEYSRMI